MSARAAVRERRRAAAGTSRSRVLRLRPAASSSPRSSAQLRRHADGFGARVVAQALRDDLGDAVAAHRHAVEDVGGLHRPLLVRDDDELRAVGEAPQQLDEAADVRVVERGLDLVEEVERARPREEEREEERDRAERLLAAGEQREPRDLLARRLELDLDAGLLAPRRRRRTSSRPLPPGKSVAATSAKCCSTARVRLLEARSTVSRQLGAQLLELLERALEVLALLDELLEPLLLPRVLLGGERVDLAERLAAPLEALDLRPQLVGLLVGQRLGLAALREARASTSSRSRPSRAASTWTA